MEISWLSTKLITIIVVSSLKLVVGGWGLYKCFCSSSSSSSSSTSNELLSDKKKLTKSEKKSLLRHLYNIFIKNFNSTDENEIVYFILPDRINFKNNDEIEFLKYERK